MSHGPLDLDNLLIICSIEASPNVAILGQIRSERPAESAYSTDREPLVLFVHSEVR